MRKEMEKKMIQINKQVSQARACFREGLCLGWWCCLVERCLSLKAQSSLAARGSNSSSTALLATCHLPHSHLFYVALCPDDCPL